MSDVTFPVAIEDNGYSAITNLTAVRNAQWNTAIGDRPLASGFVHRWEVKFEDLAKDEQSCVGVILIGPKGEGLAGIAYPGASRN